MSLPENEVAELKEHFELYDLHSAGFIVASELKFAVRGFGVNVTEESLKHALEQYDNGKGQIMFADFLEFMARKMTDPGLNEEDVTDSFSVFDKDRKGLFNTDELKNVLKQMGEVLTDKEIDAFFKEADVDADGNINYKDLLKRMNDLYEVFPV